MSIDDIQCNGSTYLQHVEAREALVILRAGKLIAEVKLVVPRVETLRGKNKENIRKHGMVVPCLGLKDCYDYDADNEVCEKR